MSPKRTKSDDEKYRSWKPGYGRFSGRLFEDPTIPMLQDAVVDEAARRLTHADDLETKKALRKLLKSVVHNYWEIKRDTVDVPPKRWYRDKIKAVHKAVKDLLALIQQDSYTALSRLELELPRQMNLKLRQRSAVPGQLQSVEAVLSGLEAVCRRLVDVKKPGAIVGKSGALPADHIKGAVEALVEIWEKFANKPFSFNFSSAENTIVRPDGTKIPKEGTAVSLFIATGPQFVQVIIQLIDPEVKLSQIRTALRGLPRKNPPG